MKKWMSIFLAAAMLFSAAACGTSSGGGSTSTTEGDTIKIGGLAPLTGSVSQYGTAVNNGILLAVKDINAKGGVLGKQIEYIVEDEQGNPKEALNAYNKLVHQDKVVAIVGDVTTKPTMAVAKVAARDNIPMISASATGEEVTTYGSNIFRACFIDPYQGELMAHYAQERINAKTAAIIYDNGDDYSSGVAAAFAKTAADLGIQVVYNEGYSSGIEDFNAQLTKIKETKPDVVMIPAYYEDVSNIISQARGLGIDAPFLGSDGWDGVLQKIDPAKRDILSNAFYCSQYSAESEKPELQAFLKEYRDTYQIDENMFAVLGYDAMQMLAAAIEKAGSTDADAIVKALTETQYDGLTGTTRFDEQRNPVREAYITTFENGKAVVKETYNF